MRRIAIGSWAYTIGPYEKSPIDFETVCARLQELGFDGVELGGFPPHPNPGDPAGDNPRWPGALPERSQRRELRQRMAERGLAFSGLAANLWSERLIDTDDPARYIEQFTRNCDFCMDLDIPRIRLDTVQPPTIFDRVDQETAFRRVTRTWQQCCDIAADRGLGVVWEPEPGFAFNKPSDTIRVHEAVDRDNFGILYDTCHGQMIAVVGARQPGERETLPGGQIDLIRMLSGRIHHVHLIDSDNTCHRDAQGRDVTSSHPPFGEGVLDFDELVPALAAENIGHDWWTIDLCFRPDAWAATEACKRSVDELNRKYG